MHHSSELTIVVIVAVALVLGAATRWATRKVPIPYTVAMLLLGALVGFGASHLPHESMLGELGLAQAVAHISPDLIIFVFLPALVFESAFGMDVHAFRNNLAAITILAIPALIITAALTALLMVGITASTWAWPMMAALVFGTLISATDPVAVVALFKELGVSKHLGTLLEGESLLNDGTSIVLFGVLLSFLAGAGDASALSVIAEFGVVVAGGIAVGIILAFIVSTWLGRTFNDPLVEITLTIVLGYAAMLIAEHFLHVSGVMAIVAGGLWMASLGRTRISPEVAHFLHRFWEVLAYIANTLVFFVVGMVVALQQEHVGLDVIGLIVVAYVAIMVVRAMVTFSFKPLLQRVGSTVGLGEAAVMSWGGLRGAVSLALALIVMQDERLDPVLRQQMFSLTTGVVMLSIVVNGWSMRKLLARFGFDQPRPAEALSQLTVIRHALADVDAKVRQIARSGAFRTIDWNNVTHDVEVRLTTVANRLEGTRLSMQDAADHERISAYWHRVLNAERESYWDAFAEGTLGSAAVNILCNRIDLHMDRLATGALEPPEERIPRARWFRAWAVRQLRRFGRLGMLVQGLDFDRMALEYDLARGQSFGAKRVLSNQTLLDAFEPAVAEEIHKTYERFHVRGKERLEEMRQHQPEVTCAIETRLASRIALNLERDAYRGLQQRGLLDETFGRDMQSDVERRMKALQQSSRTATLPSIEQRLQGVALFAHLTEAQLKTLAAHAQEVLLAPGDYLFHEGDRGTSMYVIISGAVLVLKRFPRDAHDTLLDVLGGGEIIGEMALITKQPRTASIKASTPATLVRISGADFDAMMRHMDVAKAVWRAHSERLFDNTIRGDKRFRQLGHHDRLVWAATGKNLHLEHEHPVPKYGQWCFLYDGALVEAARGRYKAPLMLSALQAEGLVADDDGARVLLLDEPN